MKFFLNRSDHEQLCYNLAIITRVISNKNPLIKIKCSSNTLIVSGIGQLGKIELYIQLKSSKNEEGSIVVLEDFVKVIKNINLDNNSEISCSINASDKLVIKVTGSKSKYTVKCLSSDNVQDIAFGTLFNTAKISPSIFTESFNVKLFCAPSSDISALSSIHLTVNKNGICFVASDKATIVKVFHKGDFSSEFSVLIPPQIANIIQILASGTSGSITIGTFISGHCVVESEFYKYLFSTVSGTYPDISKLLDPDKVNFFDINNKDLLEKLLFINTLTQDKVIQLVIDEDLIIKNLDVETLSIEECVKINSYSFKFSFYLLLKYIILFLNQFKKHSVNVRVSSNKKVMITAQVNNYEFTLITTPVIIK